MGTELLPSYWRKEITRKVKAFSSHFLGVRGFGNFGNFVTSYSGLQALSGLIIDGVSIELIPHWFEAGCAARQDFKDSIGRVA